MPKEYTHQDSIVKKNIEKVHIRYLCKEFDLLTTKNSNLEKSEGVPDLIGKEHDGLVKSIFELKSKNYPLIQRSERQRPKEDFEYYRLVNSQIEFYEQRINSQNVSAYWIFIIGETYKEPSLINYLDEKKILKRDIYVLPWNMHEQIHLTKTDHKHISLKKINNQFSFLEEELVKGKVFLEESIVDKVKDYFL